ncbi:hypothetical protein [Sulfobacillus harzensis]|uniref:Uncharacterized protein n=1 Tax=Sulfobacillus harzensis TaxID=2729629 RepID=A0A7Y0L560_9FIRM|nr:hypothetical protein [Sulfobacillus harzensis]NMP23504.1 hypothetical protein [Sulfobacillus harzensis]
MQRAITQAVETGLLWVTTGGLSVWQEPLPDGLLTTGARLNAPPTPLSVFDLLPDRVPEAWQDGKTTALALLVALSNLQGEPLPWLLVRQVITEARNHGLVHLELGTTTWPCGRADAEQVRISVGDTPIIDPPPPPLPKQRLRSDRVLKPSEVQDLADVIGELMRLLQPWAPTIQVTLDVDTSTAPMDPTVRHQVNALLSQVKDNWTL